METAQWRLTGKQLNEWVVSRQVSAVTGRQCLASSFDVYVTSSPSFMLTIAWLVECGAFQLVEVELIPGAAEKTGKYGHAQHWLNYKMVDL